MKLKNLAFLVVLSSAPALAKPPVSAITETYSHFISHCQRDGFNLPYQMNCNFITPQGELYPRADDHYKLIVDWVTPNEEDTWDELSLYYNNAILKFGDQGLPDWSWNDLMVLKDVRGAFALIAKRSAFKNQEAHYFVVSLNKDKSCRIAPSRNERFQNLSAFKSESAAISAAMKLQPRTNVPCEKKAEYIN